VPWGDGSRRVRSPLRAQGRARTADSTIEYANDAVFIEINEGKRSAAVAMTTGAIKIHGNFSMVTNLVKHVDSAKKKQESEQRADAARQAAAKEAMLTPHYSTKPKGGADPKVSFQEPSRPVRWIADTEVSSCMGCAAMFTFLNRKHHCRSCGGIFCSNCAPTRAPIQNRMCATCFSQFYVSRPVNRPSFDLHSGLSHHPMTAMNRVVSLQEGAAPRKVSAAAMSPMRKPSADPTEATTGVTAADAEAAQLAEKMAELEQMIRSVRTDAEAAGLPTSLPPSIEGAVGASELAAIIVYPLAYALIALGWRTVPLLLMLWGLFTWWTSDVWIHFTASLCIATGAVLWHLSTAEGQWELFRRRMRVFGASIVVFMDYKMAQLRAEGLQAAESAPLYNAVHRRSAVRTLLLFRELQGLWVKMGQYLSSRADVMPDQYTEVYSSLQDSMPARPLAEVLDTLREDLKQPIDSLFSNIVPEALAAASIGQVHKATIPSGLEVAIKVKHRTIDRVLNQDLANLNIILQWMQWAEPNFDLSAVMEEWSKEVLRELDLENEARQMIQVRLNLMRDGLPAVVPRIPEGMFGPRVLVMRFIDGIKMSTPILELDRMGVDREQVCRSVLRSFAHQIYVDGLFNGDPHPGNIMVIQRGALREGDDEDVREHRKAALKRSHSAAIPIAAGAPDTPTLGPENASAMSGALSPVMDGDLTEWVPVLLDFGLTKRLTRRVRLAFCKMVLAGQELDGNLLMEAFDEMGMRFSNENVLEDMEGIKHMFRDAVPKHEAREQAQAKMKQDEEKKKAKQAAGETQQERKLEAWPGELILFLRVSELLQGLCAQLEVRMPTMQIMAAAARVGMLRRFPRPRVALRPAESDSTTRLRLVGPGKGARGGIAPVVFSDPMPGLPPLPAVPSRIGGSPVSKPRPRTPKELERAIRHCLRSLKNQGAILGAQVAVFKDGLCVADVCTGQLGPLDHRAVTASSKFPLFGAGRAIAAAALWELHEKGMVDLESPVSVVWPEFGANGKDACPLNELLRCRSGIEGWLPEKLTTTALLDSAARASDVAAAAPRLLESLATDELEAMGEASESDSESAGPPVSKAQTLMRKPSMDDTPTRKADSTSSMPHLVLDEDYADKGSSDHKEPNWALVPQGPGSHQELCAHLYFGWSWAVSEVLRRVSGSASVQDALCSSLLTALTLEGEMRAGAVPVPPEGAPEAIPEPVEGGGVDDGSSGPPDVDVYAPVATVELGSEDEITASKADSVIGSELSARTPVTLARQPSADVASDVGVEEEEEEAADEHVMKTLMAAVNFHAALSSSGLNDLQGLLGGGKEHLLDPRFVNAKRTRGGDLVGTTMYGSARALACVGASLLERLSAACATKTRFSRVRKSEDGRDVEIIPAPSGPSADEVRHQSSVTVGTVALEACRSLGFRVSAMTSPAEVGRLEARSFVMAGLGGTTLFIDSGSRVAVAITVNRLLPQRTQSRRILRVVFETLGVGVPVETLV
jgi:predicted unusual protein kinase regulating ubiquinone biosynthesis (AarF/ABC1/UbiB family)/CubicO group peptidase (beta-lactamase class C family)